MKALHYLGESKLAWKSIEPPKLQGDMDALVEPMAVSMCDLDRKIVRDLSPFPGPFVLGHEFVGRVIEIGSRVTLMKQGDVVLASFQPSCGHCQPCRRAHTSVCREVPNTSMYGIGATGGDWGGAMADLIRVPWADVNLRVIPSEVNAQALAPASDNLADGLRCVETPLLRQPDSSVLIVGEGSIALYALICARHLGNGDVDFASRDQETLMIAESLGAKALEVREYPKKFGSYDVTVDCSNDKKGLLSIVRSTAPFGFFTSASIYFAPTTPMPMADMYMKGIELHTGRVNSAAQLDHVIALVQAGLDPNSIQPRYENMANAVSVLADDMSQRKLIFTR